MEHMQLPKRRTGHLVLKTLLLSKMEAQPAFKTSCSSISNTLQTRDTVQIRILTAEVLVCIQTVQMFGGYITLMFPFPVGPVCYMLLNGNLNNHDGVKYFDVFDGYDSK